MHLRGRRIGSKCDRGFLAGLAGDALGVVGVEPLARGNETGQCLRQLGDQRQPRRRGNIFTFQERLADRGQMTVTFDDPIDRERRNLGVAVFQ